MSKHTPGPWSTGDFNPAEAMHFGANMPVHVGTFDSVDRGNALAVVYLGGPGATSVSRENIIANARLIAAAPELVEALGALLYTYEGDDLGVDAANARESAIQAARAALAKAGVQ